MKQGKMHYAWMILAACCALQGGTLGLIQNTVGLFYLPVCQELGFELGEFTFHATLKGLASCAVLPLVVPLLRRGNIRVTLTIALVIMTLCTMSMSLLSQLWQWYIVGVVQGIAGAVLNGVTIPVLLGNWFRQKKGLAVGIAGTFSGVLGMIANPVGSALIASQGWRAGYVAFGLASLVLILPFTLFVFCYAPEKMGLAPYGDVAPAQSGQPMAVASFVRPSLIILVGLTVLHAAAMFTSAFNQHLVAFSASVGFTGGAMLVSISMAGNILGKLVLGALSDRTGPAWATLLSFGMALAGFLLFFYLGAALYAAAFLTGMILPSATVLMPLLIQRAYKDHGYERAYSYISVLGSIVYAFAGSIMGYLYDFSGSYVLVTRLCVVMLTASVLILAAMCTKRESA